ncbi:MAG: hypothetical protein ACQEXX_31925 [Bacillota bacterium]
MNWKIMGVVIEIVVLEAILESTIFVSLIFGLLSSLGRYSKEEQQFMHRINRGFRGAVYWILITTVY